MKLLLIGILLLFLKEETVELHPIHLTVINMEYNDATDVFEILIRVFTDDFEAVINKDYGKELKINDNSEESKVYIDKYLKQHFRIYFNTKFMGEKYKISKITHNSEKNTTEIVYILKHKTPGKIKIENTLFKAYFRDQKNLFIFTCGKTQEAFKFDRNETEFEFKL